MKVFESDSVHYEKRICRTDNVRRNEIEVYVSRNCQCSSSENVSVTRDVFVNRLNDFQYVKSYTYKKNKIRSLWTIMKLLKAMGKLYIVNPMTYPCRQINIFCL